MPEKRAGGSLFWLLSLGLALTCLIIVTYRAEFAGLMGKASREGRPAILPHASSSRVFLTAAEQIEASKRGLLPPGVQSIIGTSGPLRYGQWKWDEAGIPVGPLRVRVSLRRQLVSVFRGPHEIGTAVIVYGAKDKTSPLGRLPVLRKVRDYHSITYDAPMPYSLFIRDDGVALHGSPIVPDHATNGCVGLPVAFAAKLFDAAKVGDIIEIRDGN